MRQGELRSIEGQRDEKSHGKGSAYLSGTDRNHVEGIGVVKGRHRQKKKPRKVKYEYRRKGGPKGAGTKEGG